jgi:hypothetical protein
MRGAWKLFMRQVLMYTAIQGKTEIRRYLTEPRTGNKWVFVDKVSNLRMLW